jgi:thioesterase domain-containing protein/acyl carrier protein
VEELRAAPTDVTAAPEADQAAVESQLGELWREVGVEAPRVDADFFELGGTSIHLVALLSLVEERFDVVLPPAQVIAEPTIRSMARGLLHYEGLLDTVSPLLHITEGGDARATSRRPPLVVVAGADGVDVVAPLRRLVARWREVSPVYAARSFGLDGKTEPLTTVEEMAAAYADLVQRTVSTPAVVAGFSSGGVVALELARRLGSRRVARLILLDAVLPSPDQPPRPYAEVAAEHYRELSRTYGVDDVFEELELVWRRTWTDAGRWSPRSTSVEQFRRYHHIWILNVAAFERYRPCPVDVPLTALFSSTIAAQWPDLPNHWPTLTSADARVENLPVSGHAAFLSTPELAEALEREISALATSRP